MLQICAGKTFEVLLEQAKLSETGGCRVRLILTENDGDGHLFLHMKEAV